MGENVVKVSRLFQSSHLNPMKISLKNAYRTLVESETTFFLIALRQISSKPLKVHRPNFVQILRTSKFKTIHVSSCKTKLKISFSRLFSSRDLLPSL